jgi:hypothetical protein
VVLGGERRNADQGPIHRSAWKWNSANFAVTEFSEVHIAPIQHRRLSGGAERY